MWGKVSFHRSRRPVIGNPTLVNKTLDDSVYRSLSSIAGAQDVDKYYSSQTAPSFPPKPAGTFFTVRRPGSSHRVSSVYSEDTVVDPIRQRSVSLMHHIPSGQGALSHAQFSRANTTSPNISPPDSPAVQGGVLQIRNPSPVSPIEEESPIQASGDESKDRKFSTTHLPVLSKCTDSYAESQQLRSHPSSSSSRENTIQWDYFSVEPTTNNYVTWTRSHNSNIFSRSNEPFYPKPRLSGSRSRLSKGEISFPRTVAREPWKGLSGRSPIVTPIEERPLARSLSRARMSQSSDYLKANDRLDCASYEIIPSVITTITGGSTTTKGSERRMARSNTSYLTRLPGRDSISAASHPPPRVDLPGPDLDASPADLKLTPSNDDEPDQPTSRFSATTYEPTEPDSSIASRRNSIDTTQSSENFSSIMSRKRPVPSAVAPKKPARKPTPSQVSNEDGVSKDIDQCSPQEQTQNRINALETRRDNLARRRNNINTIIHELSQAIHPNSVYDMAAREEVKKTVASLNNELAEIKREEHEIGLKLFRAWKKRDEKHGGGSGLWVKRVTS